MLSQHTDLCPDAVIAAMNEPAAIVWGQRP